MRFWKRLSSKTKAIICGLLSFFIGWGVPILMVVLEYKLIQKFSRQDTYVKWSIFGAIVTVCLLLSLRKRIAKFLDDLDFSVIVCVINGIVKTALLGVFLFLLINATKWIDDLIFVIQWTLVCHVFVYFILDPFYNHYQKLYKKEKRQQEIKEAVTEVLKG